MGQRYVIICTFLRAKSQSQIRLKRLSTHEGMDNNRYLWPISATSFCTLFSLHSFKKKKKNNRQMVADTNSFGSFKKYN